MEKIDGMVCTHIHLPKDASKKKIRPTVIVSRSVTYVLYWDICITFSHLCCVVSLKGALYRIWCGVNRLGDSGVKVV